MVTRSSLNQLYLSACKDGYTEDLVSVFHLDKLFMETKNISYSLQNPNAAEKAIPSVAIATDYLSKDMFNTIKSIGCYFHDKLGHAHVCSNYYICKWIYIFSTHCCQYFNVKLVSGCHYDFDLSKQEVEDVDNETFLNHRLKEKPQDLTNNSFPALKLGRSSTTATNQPVWNRPVQKSDFELSAPDKTMLDEDFNFLPLGGLHTFTPEESPTNEMNVWPKRASHSESIVGQVQLRDAVRLGHKSPKKLSRGRGFIIDAGK